MGFHAWLRAGLLVALCLLCGGCLSLGGSPEVPGNGAAAGCRLGASQSSVLVTEWPAAEKANLEGQIAQGGAVAVEFSGCELRLLPEC